MAGRRNRPWLGDRQSYSYVMREIAKHRVAKGFSQAELAARAGYDQALISCYERGSSNPKVGVLEDLAEALGLTIEVRDVAAEVDVIADAE